MECLDVIEVKDAQIENQKLQIDALHEIVTLTEEENRSLIKVRDVLIKQYYISEKDARKRARGRWWNGLAVGASGGGAVVLAGFLILTQ